MNVPRINVLGVGVSILTLDSAVASIFEAIEKGLRGYVTVTGVHGISESHGDADLRKIHNDSLLTTPDGMPLTWLGRLHGIGPKRMDRVYGPDLMLRVFEQGQQRGLRHYFFGGGDGVADLLKEKMLQRFPAAQIVGTCTPPFRPPSASERCALIAELGELQPHCLWVGLSTPKQERFMAQLLADIRTSQSAFLGDTTGRSAPLIMFGVGAAFDFHAGRMPQAPRWMQRLALEWLFRLLKEPRRLWKRYLKNNPLFIARAALQLTGLRKY